MKPFAFALVLGCAGCSTYSGPPGGAPAAKSVSTTYEVRPDVVYTPAAWPQARSADLYVPQGPGPFPGVVMVHGGGWDARDRSDMTSAAKDLAARGYVVANIDYRLVPAFRHPAQVEDVRAAVAWLHAHADDLGLDPTRLAGWGYSAGAHLVALAATDHPPGASPFRAVVAGGMPADLPRYPKSPIITPFMGKPYAEDPEAWSRASPLHNVTADDPPMFLFHGTRDRLVDPAEPVAMQQKLQTAGVAVELLQLKGRGHITTFLFGGEARDRGIEFLDRYLRD
ncbi:MAG TPA: alpha/beta hydrolase [Nevskiaceae bacterium]|nr:alpha/beta hydrolase [Nevskiaceae bacterium]